MPLTLSVLGIERKDKVSFLYNRCNSDIKMPSKRCYAAREL